MLSHATDGQNSPNYAEARHEPPRHARYNSPDSLHGCVDCKWVGTSAAWPLHACPNADPDEPPVNYPIPSPRIAQLTIEALDAIRLDPHTARRITNIDVLRLLHRHLDQPTTAAVAAELAKFSRCYAETAGHLTHIHQGVAEMAGEDPTHDIDWEGFDQHMRTTKQRTMRRYITLAVNR
jgi:hypothetical protein